MNPCITTKKNGHDPLGCVRMAYCTGYGAFRKTSTADAVARSFLLTPDFAVGKSSFFRRFDEPHFCYAKTGFMNPCITAKKNGHDPYGCVRMAYCTGYGALPHFFRTLRAFCEKLRVLPTPQSAKADAPLRLLRRTYFCYAKTGFMNPCIAEKTDTTR